MRSLLNKAKHEGGSVTVVALLILVLITIIGISVTTTTEIEQRIAGNYKFRKIAFYNADSGIYITPKLISACIDADAEINTGAGTTAPGITYLGSSGTLYREIMGFDPHDPDWDIRFSLGGLNGDVDIDRTGQETLPGGGAEFGSGEEGIGVGSAGGVAILYDIDSFGSGPAHSTSNVGAVYRKVLGVPGGL